MKRVFVICLILLTLLTPTSFAATEAEIVASFKNLVNEQMIQALSTYEGNINIRYVEPKDDHSKKGYWKKTVNRLDTNYKIDVKRTSSLISPYSAVLEALTGSYHSYSYPTKELATNAPTTYMKFETRHILNYGFQEGKWVLIDFKQMHVATPKLTSSPDNWAEFNPATNWKVRPVGQETFEILKMQ